MNMEINFKSNTYLTKIPKKKKVKAGSIIGTCAGVGTALALIGKHQGAKVFKKPDLNKWNKPKDWEINKINFEEKEILALSGSSVVGGLTGGGLFDEKENIKPKVREGVFQMIANMIVPIICVGGGIRIFDKFISPKLNISKPKQNIIKGIMTIGTLAAGAIGGNYIGNILNEKVFNSKKKRKLELKDLSGHLDDSCLALTLITQGKGIFGKIASRFIPVALLIPGFETGQKTKNDA